MLPACIAATRLEHLQPVVHRGAHRHVAGLGQRRCRPARFDHRRETVGQCLVSPDWIDPHPRRHAALGARQPMRDLGTSVRRRSGTTASSRSRITASAPLRGRLAKRSGRSPGTNSIDASGHRLTLHQRGTLADGDFLVALVKQRCTKTTMPASGRERLSRISCTTVSVRRVSPGYTGLGKRTSSQPR